MTKEYETKKALIEAVRNLRHAAKTWPIQESNLVQEIRSVADSASMLWSVVSEYIDEQEPMSSETQAELAAGVE